MRTFNDEQTRMISDEDAAFAIVGYVGEVVDGVFTGGHAGCFHDGDSALAWLRGEGEPDFRMEYSVES